MRPKRAARCFLHRRRGSVPAARPPPRRFFDPTAIRPLRNRRSTHGLR